jgi:hypothetical protein
MCLKRTLTFCSYNVWFQCNRSTDAHKTTTETFAKENLYFQYQSGIKDLYNWTSCKKCWFRWSTIEINRIVKPGKLSSLFFSIITATDFPHERNMLFRVYSHKFIICSLSCFNRYASEENSKAVPLRSHENKPTRTNYGNMLRTSCYSHHRL